MQQGYRKNRTVGIIVIWLYFVALAVVTFLFPIIGVRLPVDFTFIQSALIVVEPPGFVHVVIITFVPLFGILFGSLFFNLRAAGWWGIVMLSSYNAFLYLIAFVKSYVFDIVIRYEHLSMPHWIELKLLLPAILYTSILFFTFRAPVMELYGVANINKLKVGSILMLANVLFAISVYQLK